MKRLANKNNNVHCWVIVAMLFISQQVLAQNTRLSDHNNIVWCNFFCTIPVSSQWSLHSDVQIRRVDLITNPQQMLYRIGVNYQLKPDILIRIGGAYVQTYPYGDHPLNSFAKKTEEYRLFQMMTISHKSMSCDLSHRFMLEQRWNGKFNSALSDQPESWPLSNRMRYMFRVQKSIHQQQGLYLSGYNELFIGFGKNVSENIFDQNRLALMAGKNWSKHLRTEFGYFVQTQQLSREVNGANVIQYNKGLILNTYCTL